ncbi:MAG: diacylglycerol kinase family protein [Bacteroidota bacterium]
MKFLTKFRFAFEGLFYLIKKDKNFQIHLLLFLVLLSFGFCLALSQNEWITILICSTLVLSLEAINSALEKLCDLVHAEKHPEIKKIKDISAGAVLIAAIFSCVVAGIIFIPKILDLF